MNNEESVTKGISNYFGTHASVEPKVTSSYIDASNIDVPGVNVNDVLKQANKLGVVMKPKHLHLNYKNPITHSTFSDFGKPCRQCTLRSAFFIHNASHLSGVISAFSLRPDIIMMEDIIIDF